MTEANTSISAHLRQLLNPWKALPQKCREAPLYLSFMLCHAMCSSPPPDPWVCGPLRLFGGLEWHWHFS